MRTPTETEKEASVTCSSGSIIEEYLIEFPKGLKVLSIPKDLKLNSEFLSYSANYRLQRKTLTVRRILEDRTRGNVCSPQYFARYKKMADKVMDNLKEQVLYK